MIPTTRSWHTKLHWFALHANVPTAQKLVLIVIASRMDSDFPEIQDEDRWSSETLIEANSGLPSHALAEILGKLEENGLVLMMQRAESRYYIIPRIFVFLHEHAAAFRSATRRPHSHLSIPALQEEMNCLSNEIRKDLENVDRTKLDRTILGEMIVRWLDFEADRLLNAIEYIDPFKEEIDRKEIVTPIL